MVGNDVIPLWWGKEMRIPVPALKMNHSIVGKINFLCMVEQWGFLYGGDIPLFNSKNIIIRFHI